jgi:hypothetical protein
MAEKEEKKPVIIKAFPEPHEYQEDEKAFLCAVGLCITRWAFVDRCLFRLFRVGIGAATFRAALVYYDQHSINTRLRQVDSLLKELFSLPDHEEYRTRWKDLCTRINDLMPTRNVIAHQPTQRRHTSDGEKAIYVYGIYIEPHQRHLKKEFKGMKGKDALQIDDLIAHADAAEDLVLELTSFTKKVIRAFR